MVFAIFKKSGEVDIGGGQPSTPETPSLSTSELVLHRKSHSRWKYMFLAALVVIFAILLPVIIWFAARPGKILMACNKPLGALFKSVCTSICYIPH